MMTVKATVDRVLGARLVHHGQEAGDREARRGGVDARRVDGELVAVALQDDVAFTQPVEDQVAALGIRGASTTRNPLTPFGNPDGIGVDDGGGGLVADHVHHAEGHVGEAQAVGDPQRDAARHTTLGEVDGLVGATGHELHQAVGVVDIPLVATRCGR
jgi:hypothetical protein